jgi:hypothetical protein
MSALGQIRTLAPQQIVSLFKHFVSMGEQLRGHGESERPGGFQIPLTKLLQPIQVYSGACLLEVYRLQYAFLPARDLSPCRAKEG